MSTKIEATITEAGNGLPSVGELVYCASTNTVYRITSTGDNISTHAGGRGNSIAATLEDAGEPADYTDEEFSSMENYRVLL